MPLVSTLTIIQDLRRPQDVPKSWHVTGVCNPSRFYSLNDARVFVHREARKFLNGSLIPFEPTHMILWQTWRQAQPRRRIPVRMVQVAETTEAALYIRDDWRPCKIPEWGYDTARNKLLLQGIPMGVSWRLVNYGVGIGNFVILDAIERNDTANFYGEAP